MEDPLPAYDVLPMNDDGVPKDDNEPVRGAGHPGRPITSSLRATYRLLRSTGSWRASFRGLGYATVLAILTLVTVLFISLLPFVSVSIAHLITLIVVAPLATAWTHVVITAPGPSKSFFSRIPPIRKVYLATWFPTFLLWAAANASVLLPVLLSRVIGLNLRDPANPDQIRSEPPRGSEIAKVVCVLGVSLALEALLVVPAHTALTRVQASLLPADEDTLVPFDRSFGGRVEPEVVSGRGFATFGAALKTVPVASWVRIYLLRVKVFFVSVAAYVALGLVVLLQALIVHQALGARKGEHGN